MTMFEFSLSRAIIRSKYTIALTLGAILGVACLIVITSLFNNYYLTSENIFMGIHPHIRITKEGMKEPECQTWIRRLTREFPSIQVAKPALYKHIETVISRVNKKKFFCIRRPQGLVCYDETRDKGNVDLIPRYGFTIVEKKKATLLVKGISVENNDTVSGIKKIIAGSIRLDDLNINFDENKNPLPWSFYMQQDIFFGIVGLKDFLLQFPTVSPKQHHFLQRGTLGLGTQKGKYPLLVMSMENARKCLGEDNTANVIEIKLADPYRAEDLSKQLKQRLGTPFRVESWIHHSRASFAFLKIIRIMILAIIFSISIVAAIGMVSTLTLIVMQNKGKIAILKSMGIKNSGIYKIFVLNTGLTGLIGVTTGTLLGYLLSHLMTGYFSESLRKLGIKNPQTLLETGEVITIGILVMLLFLLTAVIPSRRAVSEDVVQGLQEQ